MSETELSDRQLVKQFQKGDSVALDVFIRRHQDRLMRIALVTLYAAKDAEDAVQETFLRAYKGLSSFRFSAEPFTWMYRTLKNVCSELNKKQTRFQNSSDYGNVEDTLRQEQDEMGEGFATFQLAAQVRKLVDGLPPQQREVVLLRVFEELSVQHTAKILGCKEGTVKAHLHKAMKNLRIGSEQLHIAKRD